MSTNKMREALEAARQFIVNGIECGYILMPDRNTPDSAHDTLPMIDAALAVDDTARGTMRGEFEAWWTREGATMCIGSSQSIARAAWQASRAAAPQGEVVVTKNKSGQIVCVTRQDADGQILSVIAEAAAPQSVEPTFYMKREEFEAVIRGDTQWEPAMAERHHESDVPLYLAPPSAPTDAEWEAEHLRLVRSYGKACWAAGAGGDAIACLAISDALGALHAHLSARPQQAAPTEADRLDAWIACSERMPKPETDVLCWVVDPFCRRFEVAGLFRGA